MGGAGGSLFCFVSGSFYNHYEIMTSESKVDANY